MAKNVLVLSARAGAGQTTISVNLAVALSRQGHKVLIAAKGSNAKLFAWLGLEPTVVACLPPAKHTFLQPVPTRLGVDFCYLATADNIPATLAALYQYIFLLPAQAPDCESLLPGCSHIIVCDSPENKAAPAQLISLEQRLSQLLGKSQPISLVVMNKINTKEWHNNLEYFSALADHFGYEKIADPLPHCERIHDLPLQGLTVGELSQENLRDAFMRLTEMVKSW